MYTTVTTFESNKKIFRELKVWLLLDSPNISFDIQNMIKEIYMAYKSLMAY